MRRILLAISLVAVLLLPTAAVGDRARTTGPAPGVCQGVEGCRVVARTDVTGDGQRDAVGLIRRGKSGAPEGTVTVRVRTAAGRIVSTTRRTEYWHGPLWQGAGRLDGRAGTDLVVGRIQGAHAQFFTVLTWRRGELVTLNAPGRGRYWGIDAAVWISLGWQHRAGDPDGVVRKRMALREGDATSGPFRGRITTFRWTRDGWQRVDRRTIYPMSGERAARWGGWRVPGVDRW